MAELSSFESRGKSPCGRAGPRWKSMRLSKPTQHIARAVGIRLTKAKLAQVVPVVGAAVGSGFNAYYTARVCDAAYYLYRERFMAERYGPGVIEITVQPQPDAGVRYEDADEAIPWDYSGVGRMSWTVCGLVPLVGHHPDKPRIPYLSGQRIHPAHAGSAQSPLAPFVSSLGALFTPQPLRSYNGAVPRATAPRWRNRSDHPYATVTANPMGRHDLVRAPAPGGQRR